MFKTWFISTWGGGTPDYLVTAESKERAWQLVEKDWREKRLGYYVGERPYATSYVPGKDYQTAEHLKEVEGFFGDQERVIDLHKL